MNIQLEFQGRENSQVWRFRGARPTGGWAHLHICETTGEISIQSDWGELAYRWMPQHTGCDSMKAFFVKAHPDYLLTKFGINTPIITEVVDEHETRKCLRALVIEKRREGSISAENARCLWDRSIERFCLDVGGEAANSAGFTIGVMSADEELKGVVAGEFGLAEHVRWGRGGAAEAFYSYIIPQMQAHIRKELEEGGFSVESTRESRIIEVGHFPAVGHAAVLHMYGRGSDVLVPVTKEEASELASKIYQDAEVTISIKPKEGS